MGLSRPLRANVWRKVAFIVVLLIMHAAPTRLATPFSLSPVSFLELEAAQGERQLDVVGRRSASI
jgi:hypothetical protein